MSTYLKVFIHLQFYIAILNTIDLIKQYIDYRIYSKTKYDIHSPFLFDFITKVLDDKNTYDAYALVDRYKNQLKKNKQLIEVIDYGAPSKYSNQNKILVHKMASNTAIHNKYGKLLFRMVKYYQPKTIIEIGTGLGISTAYMAAANQHEDFFTLEGNPSLLEINTHNFKNFKFNNVNFLLGNFNKILPEILASIQNIDFAFIDGNHQKEATIRYYNLLKSKCNNNSILIFDDIRWSDEMYEAWQEIIQDNDVTLSLDLFRMGIVFFRKEIHKKQHYAICY